MPSSSTGVRRSSSIWYDGAAAWWNSSTITTSKCAGRWIRFPELLRLWIDAKTCSKRDGLCPRTQSSPKLASRSACPNVARLCSRISWRCATNSSRCRGKRVRRRVVDRRHHGLARARGGDEQVAVMPGSAGQLDLLEEPLLKRSQLDLDRAQQDRVLALGGRGPLEELVVIEGDEVAARPVRLEDGAHLRDDVGIPHSRDADVPFESGDHRRVREVRRADVRGRVPAPAVEEPRLGMEARGGRVVGDLDLGSERRQLVERSQFGAVRVGRGDDAKPLAGFAMSPQHVHHRTDAAPPHEGHHDVDGVRRVNLGA